MGASAPVKVANSKTDDYRTVSADRDEVQQFCEKYFSDLSVNNNGSDDFGRPSEQWKNGSKEIGTYASTADASYTEEVKSKTIYSDLGLGETCLLYTSYRTGRPRRARPRSPRGSPRWGRAPEWRWRGPPWTLSLIHISLSTSLSTRPAQS